MRKTLTDKGVSALKPRAGRYAYPDPQLAGHYVRITPNGAKSFATVTRDPNGKQIWTTLGATDRMSIEDAREMAREAITRVRAGQPAFEPRKDSFGDVVANWLKRHVEAKGVRTRYEITRLLNKHILPAWRDREFVSIQRSDITRLLDKLEDSIGARQTDYCLNIIRSVMNWHALRVDGYNPPIVRGMKRQSGHAQRRSRVLSDDEIRAVWKAAEVDGSSFGRFLQFALLTAQRRDKVRTMRWDDISDAGEWTIPKEPREKDTGGVLVLPPIALDIVRKQPRLGTNPYVFAAHGDGAINGFSALRKRFDRRVSNVEPYTIHDLRRSARSLMSRAGVISDHAERVMGHAIGGVEGIYDRHAYKDEKADALKRLAALIDGIVHPRDNVTPMVKRARRR